jgi:hypothetical protein
MTTPSVCRGDPTRSPSSPQLKPQAAVALLAVYVFLPSSLSATIPSTAGGVHLC